MKGIEVKNISKSFKDTQALRNVTLTFEAEKIYGLLGRNGAGKSTLLNIISNRKYPNEGYVSVDGVPSAENDEALRKMFLINEMNLYPESMKVKDAFKVTKTFYPSFDEANALKLSEMFELNIKKKIKSLSTGYQSIFRNILALSVNVPYVFFDEPVLGLDAYHRDLFYRLLIEKYSEEPFTAVISTHLIEEVANVIEEVIIIKKVNFEKSVQRQHPGKQLHRVRNNLPGRLLCSVSPRQGRGHWLGCHRRTEVRLHLRRRRRAAA